jgi:flagellar biosynthetic protein FliQ
MMTSQTVLTLGQQALEVALLVSMPLLLAALVTGLAVSVLQAATQINEATLSFIPKLLAMVATLAVAGPWMLATLTEYLQRLLVSIPQAVG